MTDDTMPEAHFESLDQLEYHYWWHQHRVRLALQLFGRTGLKAPRYLDIGSGTGGFLQQFVKGTGAVRGLGIETSPVGIRACQEKGLDVLDKDLMQPVVLDEEPFDVATAMDVLEHLPDERPAIEMVWENLRPGGYFIISVPALPSMWSTWDEHLGHFRRYTVPVLRDVLESKNFTVPFISYAFGFILAPAWLRRMAGKDYTETTCEFPPVHPVVNSCLHMAGRLEAAWLKCFKVPVGLSVIALARKPE